ncbi:MAG: hypothetical protein ACXWF8_00405 [Methylobacter sp.]
MSNHLIAKISSEMSSIYGAVTQHSRLNDLNMRANLRREIQSRLKAHVDNKSIASFKVICDETNNNLHGSSELIKVDIVIKITPTSHQHVVSLPLEKSAHHPKKTVSPQKTVATKKAAPKKGSLWTKLFG